jgi:hypothetical protein
MTKKRSKRTARSHQHYHQQAPQASQENGPESTAASSSSGALTPASSPASTSLSSLTSLAPYLNTPATVQSTTLPSPSPGEECRSFQVEEEEEENGTAGRGESDGELSFGPDSSFNPPQGSRESSPSVARRGRLGGACRRVEPGGVGEGKRGAEKETSFTDASSASLFDHPSFPRLLSS